MNDILQQLDAIVDRQHLVAGESLIADAANEIERLTAERDQLLEQIASRQPSVVERDMQLVMASNNRLRAALEEIESTDRHMDPKGNPWRGPCGVIARKALANKQE